MATAFESLVLERLKVAHTQHLSSYVIRNSEVSVVVDAMTGNLVVRMESHVLADRLEPTSAGVSFVAFASTWQHVKASAFPTFSRWLRRPPRTKTVRVPITADSFATFPECRSDYPPELGRAVRLSIVRPTDTVDLT